VKPHGREARQQARILVERQRREQPVLFGPVRLGEALVALGLSEIAALRVARGGRGTRGV
jgi:hypothetical protein